MQKKNIDVISYDGNDEYVLNGILWLPDSLTPKKIIHIVHGMTEHIDRYNEFADQMTKLGVAIVGFDLRGHGKNFGRIDCGTFSFGCKNEKKNYGWENAINDINNEICKIKDLYPNSEYYLLGFSMGSFLVRDYIAMNFAQELNGVILVGTGYQPSFVSAIMKFIVGMQVKKAGIGNTTNLVRKLAFDTYNKHFVPNITKMDWLCSDKEQLSIYLEDPLIRKDISADLFYEMIASMHRVNKRGYFNNRSLMSVPFLLISGDEDAVGNMGSGIQKVKDVLVASGVKSVDTLVLPNARHDVFHECENGTFDKIIDYLIVWLHI